ncbi:hypothetical protein RHS01_07013 [Rhizoctonia solani]|uniref:Uncharacterized protein n=1 Tax=Rhizoctonia solani TaxID=456999 RepID=A0A8H7I818_9AGAM|nr:hypothetical protein RHS01_07013 [Rhizoctonia solani]
MVEVNLIIHPDSPLPLVCPTEHGFKALEKYTVCYIFEEPVIEYERKLYPSSQLDIALVWSLAVLVAVIITGLTVFFPPSSIEPLNEADEPYAPSRDVLTLMSRRLQKCFREGEIESSRGAQAQADSGRECVGSSLFIHGSQSDNPGVAVKQGTTGSKELGTIPGSKRGSTGPVHQSSLFNSDWLDLFQTGLNHSASSLVDRFIVLIRYPSIAWFGSGPLLGTLYGRTPTLSIFAISSTDFEDDVKVLADTLMPLYPQNFQLTNGHQGAPDRHLLIYVTSHGDTNNDMFISESKRLKESDLFGLFSQLAIVATILVDICREGNTPSISPPEGISVIRSCSLAQKAGTFRIKGLAAPGSCFLNAVMIAACTPNLQHDDDGYRIRLSREARQRGKVHALSQPHRSLPEPTKQTIDWGDARQSTDDLSKLMKSLANSEIAMGVYHWFMENQVFCTVNGIPYPVATEADTAPNLAFQPVHRPPGHAGQLERGAMSPLAISH